MNLIFSDEIAVIDEIQLMKDYGRGWAWTRALLGVCANEIHVCGEPGAVGLVRRKSLPFRAQLFIYLFQNDFD